MPIVCALITAYYFVLLARIILSWTTMFWSPPPALSPAIKVVYDLTEPVMGFFRRYIPPVGGLDISAIFVFIILGILRRYVGC